MTKQVLSTFGMSFHFLLGFGSYFVKLLFLLLFLLNLILNFVKTADEDYNNSSLQQDLMYLCKIGEQSDI